IAWKVAKCCHDEGAAFTLTNAPVALRLGAINQLASECNAQVIPADVTSDADMENLLDKSIEILGGKIDFILHSVGMSLNIRKGKSYTALDYEFMKKTLDISAISLHRLLQTCMTKHAISEWRSVVALTYITGTRVFPDY